MLLVQPDIMETYFQDQFIWKVEDSGIVWAVPKGFNERRR